MDLLRRVFVLDVRGGTVALALEVDDGADEVEVARLAGVTFEVDIRHGDSFLVITRVDFFGGIG